MGGGGVAGSEQVLRRKQQDFGCIIGHFGPAEARANIDSSGAYLLVIQNPKYQECGYWGYSNRGCGGFASRCLKGV